MNVLVADDDRLTRTILARTLEGWGFTVVAVENGEAAWEMLAADPPPAMAILDWMMPGVDGPELCRRIRRDDRLSHLYVLLLTSRDSRHDLVAGLEAGADDYLVKPPDADELRARLNVGVRVIGLQERLAEQVGELQTALASVRQLRGLLPICSYCKRVRSDEDYWEQIETYIGEHSDTQFSHGICPACMERAMNDFEVPESERPKKIERRWFPRWGK